MWVEGANTQRNYDDALGEAKRYEYTYEVVPLHAIVPGDLSRVIERLNDEGEVQLFLRKFKKGALVGDDRVYLKRDENRWKVRAW